MIRRSIITAALLTLWCLPHVAAAQDSTFWKAYGGVGFAHMDGRSEKQPATNTVERTDINDGIIFRFTVERRITQSLGVSLGGLGWSDHDFIRRQTFSDGTEFETRASFPFKALSVGVAGHFFEDRIAHLTLELFIMYAWYDDVVLENPDPPYGLGNVRVVSPDARPGMGLFAGLEIPLGSTPLSLNPWAGVAITQFTETFFQNDRVQGASAVDVRLTPVMGGISLGLRL